MYWKMLNEFHENSVLIPKPFMILNLSFYRIENYDKLFKMSNRLFRNTWACRASVSAFSVRLRVKSGPAKTVDRGLALIGSLWLRAVL